MSKLDRLRELVHGAGAAGVAGVARPGPADLPGAVTPAAPAAPAGGAEPATPMRGTNGSHGGQAALEDVRRAALSRGLDHAAPPASRVAWREAEELGTAGAAVAGRAAALSHGLRELTYEPVDRDGMPLPAPSAMPSLAGASQVDTPLGRCVVVDHLFAADSDHGRHRVEHGVVSADEVIDFCGALKAEPAGGPEVLFLDLETTGLSGGAGTLAFLVGCGFFEDGGFRTRQFLLPAFSAERALLHAVTELIADAGCLVTYNGRTFDVPVMETRWLFHRVAPPWTELPHLDMLPLSRRLWRDREQMERAGCRLVTLEHDLFGVVRHGDVPGYEIPGRYFEYVRGGDAALLEPVLHHNRLDLLSLALLTARALRLFRDGGAGARDPQECLAVGRELWRRNDVARAEACFRAAADAPVVSGAVRGDALYAWACLLRRERRYVEAAAIWTRLASCRGARPGLAHEAMEALAIHYEHRDRDLGKAHEWATGAFEPGSADSRREAMEHRLARLRRKMAVQAKGGPQAALLLDGLF